MPWKTPPFFFRNHLEGTQQLEGPSGKMCPRTNFGWVVTLFFDLPKTFGMLGQAYPENNTPWKINGKNNLKIPLIEKIENENHLKETSIFWWVHVNSQGCVQ